MLDVGSNYLRALHVPEYLGWRHERITGAAYDDFIARFVLAVRQELPGTLLQWEDFGASHARPILDTYRDKLLTFNDDIQGTGAIVLAAALSAARVTGVPIEDQRVVVFGAGAAAVGVADILRAEMVEASLHDEVARDRFWLVNRGGLVHSRREDLKEEQRPYAHPWEEVAAFAHADPDRVSLSEVVKAVRPTFLIGLSTVGGAFDEPLVREMASTVERPVIFPLSNPTSKSEAVP